MNTEAPVLIETIGRVGLITLNRPKQLNALNDALMDALGQALLAFDADDGIGAIVITGSAKAFAAGADIAAMADWSYMDVYRSDFITRNWETIRRVRKPVIAAVAGFAMGGGCELALACDIVIAAESAKFALPEVKLAMLPGAGGTQRLPRAIGKAKAMDMCLSARVLDAAEADRYGLVSRVVPDEQLLRHTLALATHDRRLFAARADGDQGVGQPRLRVAAERGHRLRAAPAARPLRQRRRPRRHEGLPRQAQARLHPPLNSDPQRQADHGHRLRILRHPAGRSVQRFVRERLVPAEDAVEEHDEVPADIVEDMKAMGLFGLSIPEEYGGIGLSMSQECRVAYELGHTALAFRSVFGTNVGIGSQGILMDGTEAQKQELLPRVASGELIMSFALTEPDAGSDSAALKTRGELDGDHYVLNGSKRFITNAPRAGAFTLMARTDGPGAGGISAFIVPAGLPGLEPGQAGQEDGPARHQDLRRDPRQRARAGRQHHRRQARARASRPR